MRGFVTVGLLLLFNNAGQVHAGDQLPTEADVRKSIERGLPFVEKDGLAWIKRRDCMSCHTVTFMLWAHTEAKSHGIAVDEKKLAEWTKWSLDKSLATRVFFKLDDKAIKAAPEAIRPKLGKLLDENFTHEKDLVAALAKALTPDELKQHLSVLVKQAATSKKVEGNDGGGLDTMAQLFLARDRGDQDKSSNFYASTADLIVRMQDPAGTWKAGGQLPSRRWSRPTADQTTTMWTILALSTYDQSNPAVKKSVDKAHAAVKKPQGDGNLEWLVARVLYEHQFGTPEQKATTKEQLLKRQNPDGGWGVLPNAKSDAFSTGQSLYALCSVRSADTDADIRRGQKFLLDTQNPDGSWTVFPGLTSNGGPDRLKKLEPIWKNWGSSWAVIGLAKSLPQK